MPLKDVFGNSAINYKGSVGQIKTSAENVHILHIYC
jgi:hypothetical protein